MVENRHRTARAAYGAIHHFDSMLFHLLLYHEPPAVSALHEQHTDGGVGDTTCLRSDKYMVEDFHALRSDRSSDRVVVGILGNIHVQPCKMAMPRNDNSRTGRHKPYDSSPTFTRAGGGWFYGGILCRAADNRVNGNSCKCDYEVMADVASLRSE